MRLGKQRNARVLGRLFQEWNRERDIADAPKFNSQQSR